MRVRLGQHLQRQRRHGPLRADCYGVSPWAIFVRPDSKIRKPEDLKDVPVSVGMRAGSHFNVPYRLEKYLPLENIKTVNTGGFGARLKALLDGEVEAASLLPPQIDMAKQLGLRTIIEDEFQTLWWVPETADRRTTCAPICAASIAPRRRCNADLKKYLPLWKKCVPPEFEDGYKWDFEVHARRALRLPAAAARRIRRGDGAGQALGARRLPEGAALRQAGLPRAGLKSEDGRAPNQARPPSRNCLSWKRPEQRRR